MIVTIDILRSYNEDVDNKRGNSWGYSCYMIANTKQGMRVCQEVQGEEVRQRYII